MEVHPALLLFLLSCLATTSYAHNVHLSALNQSLIVSTTTAPNKVLKIGLDQVTITWSYNDTLPRSADTNYTTVEVKLCYAPVSQSGRDDRKTDDSLDNDKTCPFDITDEPYKRSNNSYVWTIPSDIPTATYFVRVYVINAKNHEIAYGQSTNSVKASNLFQIEGVADDQVQASASQPMLGSFFGYGVNDTTSLTLCLRDQGLALVNPWSSGFCNQEKCMKYVSTGYGVTFSSLQRSLVVTASTTNNQVLKAGEDNITVTWGLNQTFPAGTDSAYKTVKVKLCYAPISQKDRSWRKTVDEMKKDKTCQHKIVSRPYSASNNSFSWTILRDVPSATYFVRAYAFNADGHEVAFGQSTNAQKATNLIEVQAITGRHVSLDIASVCFSAFSVVALAGFFYMEKSKGKASK
ncbi:hypothetical protein OSB04_004273 [Centaurea solstitialis]|uniref:High-affinity nitrate transporter n=1 Tax=Centaurea solstitialis TaxID=347529 RepID=A0AA38WNY8_9ASTR|nr:hypothetical protein OSB04_004273 [Centaurea solstitialis]